MAGYDCKCPHCGHDLEPELNRHWGDKDYSTDFRITCESCKRYVKVIVETVPQFLMGIPRCLLCQKAKVGWENYCPTCREKLMAKEIAQ